MEKLRFDLRHQGSVSALAEQKHCSPWPPSPGNSGSNGKGRLWKLCRRRRRRSSVIEARGKTRAAARPGRNPVANVVFVASAPTRKLSGREDSCLFPLEVKDLNTSSSLVFNKYVFCCFYCILTYLFPFLLSVEIEWNKTNISPTWIPVIAP